MNCVRAAHTAVTMNDRIFVIGGYDGQARLASIEVFDIKRDTWERLPDMSAQRTCAAGVVIKGKIHVWGGNNGGTLNSGEVFDPIENSWSTSSQPMIFAREMCSMVILDDMVYAIGGLGFTASG